MSEIQRNVDTLTEENEDLQIEHFEKIESDVLISESLIINQDGTMVGFNCKKMLKKNFESFDCIDEISKLTYRVIKIYDNHCQILRFIQKDCKNALVDLLMKSSVSNELNQESRIEILKFRQKQFASFSSFGKLMLIEKKNSVLLLSSMEDKTINDARFIKIYSNSGQSFLIILMNIKTKFDSYEIAKKLMFEGVN